MLVYNMITDIILELTFQLMRDNTFDYLLSALLTLKKITKLN